jgi:serine/threonine protein kinase
MSWLSDGAVQRLRRAAEAPDLSGTRYRLLERLGRGGMGVVFLADDLTLDRRVALKVLDLPDDSGELSARLLREAHILARLEHPGIVPIHDAGTLADGRVFYAMKYVEGNRLEAHAAALASLPDRLRVFQKICDAVAFAHSRGVLHRDLKPDNIMVGHFGEVLVLDWGVAKILRDRSPESGSVIGTPFAPAENAPITAHGTVLGTPGYMSPEQARGDSAHIDQRSDVYAMGALLRLLLTSRSPEVVASDGTGTPPALSAVCFKAMAPEPAGRYASVVEMAADVTRFLQGVALVAYPDNLFRKAGRFLDRHKTAVLLVLAYLVTRVLLIILARR